MPPDPDQWLRMPTQKRALSELYEWRHRVLVLQHVLMMSATTEDVSGLEEMTEDSGEDTAGEADFRSSPPPHCGPRHPRNPGGGAGGSGGGNCQAV